MNPIFVTLLALLAASVLEGKRFRVLRLGFVGLACASLLAWPALPGHTIFTWISRSGSVLIEIGLVYYAGSEIIALAVCLLVAASPEKHQRSASIIGALIIFGMMGTNIMQMGLAWFCMIPWWISAQNKRQEIRTLVHILSVVILCFSGILIGVSFGELSWTAIAAHDATALSLSGGLIGLSALMRMDVFHRSVTVPASIAGLTTLSGWALLHKSDSFMTQWPGWENFYGWAATPFGLLAALFALNSGRIGRIWGMALLLGTHNPIGMALACIGIGAMAKWSNPKLHAVLSAIWIAFHVDHTTDIALAGLTLYCWISLFRKPIQHTQKIHKSSLLRRFEIASSPAIAFVKMGTMTFCIAWGVSLAIRLASGSG